MRHVVGGRAAEKQAASASQIGRFETDVLTHPDNPRRIALPASVKHWTLTTLRDKLIKIGGKRVRHARYVSFQQAEVVVPRRLYGAILERIRRFSTIPPRAALI